MIIVFQYSRPWFVAKKDLVSIPFKTAISYFSILETEYGHRIALYIALKHTFYTPFKPLCLPLHVYLYVKSFSKKQKKKNFRFLTKAPLGKDICFTCTHLKSSYLFCLVTKKIIELNKIIIQINMVRCTLAYKLYSEEVSSPRSYKSFFNFPIAISTHWLVW